MGGGIGYVERTLIFPSVAGSGSDADWRHYVEVNRKGFRFHGGFLFQEGEAVKISSRDRWVRLCGRLVLALAAVSLVPACDKEKTILGTAGPQGPAGPSGANPPAPWSEPVNISNQVVDVGGDAYGQQAVFTPDGRLHVVYFAYDWNTNQDQLFYTSAQDPYVQWDTPVPITQEHPLGFDLAAASDNSVHVVFACVDPGYFYLFYLCNSAAQRNVFSKRLIRQTNFQVTGGALLMRGSVAHGVWTESDYANKWAYLYYSNSTQGWPLSGNPEVLSVSTRELNYRSFTFTSDPAGNFHLVYKNNQDWDPNQRYLYYRALPVGSSQFGDEELVNDHSTELLSWTYESPIVQFDGSNNVYVFWRRWSYTGMQNEPNRAVMCNIRPASGTFQGTSATVVTLSPHDDSIFSGDYYPLFDVQVAADGRIHAVWKTDSSYGTNDLYPLYYRTKAPGLIPFTGWQDAEVVAWLVEPANSEIFGGGLNRTALVRPAADGSVHVFYSDMERYPGDYYVGNLQHACRPSGSSTWYSTGSITDQTVDSRYMISGGAYCYFLEAGIEEDGCPFSLFAADPATGYSMNGDLAYTHYWAGEWAPGVDVNGPNHAEVYGSFWVGRDPQGRLHAIWQQEVDPFDNSGYYDLLHSNSPVVSGSFWAPEQEPMTSP